MKFATNIGLEIHIQLKTKSKMFCGCDNNAEDKPANTAVCPICMGFPGVLPVANKQAISWTLKTALALNCQILPLSKFDRKHYFYPDLPKNYQISQYDLPFAKNGWLEVENEKGERSRVRIKRVHLEEDTAKLIHPEGADYSLVDFNRAGTPLMEIVTEPDITSPFEARVFLQELRRIVRYLGVSDADMEKGHLRCDANISLRKDETLGTPVEIKNMNSFRMVERALLYEQKRQAALLEQGGRIIRETRGWLDKKGVTAVQRGKEEASDYRYFPEPDLPPFVFSGSEIEKIRTTIGELPRQRKERFMKKLGLSLKEAATLTETEELADYFEEVLKEGISPKKAANWILVELLGALREEGKVFEKQRISPSDLAELIKLIEKGSISGKIGKEVFRQMLKTGSSPQWIIKNQQLRLVKDEQPLYEAIKEVLKSQPAACADYRRGKSEALQFLIGQVMKITKGQADPLVTRKILKEVLNDGKTN